MLNQIKKQSIKNEAMRGSIIGGITYIFLSVLKLVTSYYFHSASLRADGFNNLSDVLSTSIITLSIYIANRPADSNHRFGHERYETIGSIIASLLMFTIGFDVIKESTQRIYNGDYPSPNILVIAIAMVSVFVLFIVYRIIMNIANRTRSIGLKATAKDMSSDMLVTLSTIIGTIGALYGYPQIDTIISVIVGLVIIYSAFEIFSESTFTLSDGFDQEALNSYKEAILAHRHVYNVKTIRGRMSGQLIYIDVVIEVSGYLSVLEAHEITDEIEEKLINEFEIHDVDIHVEPFEIRA